jgi:hypothetical protein
MNFSKIDKMNVISVGSPYNERQLVYIRNYVHFFNVIMIINCEYKLSKSQDNHICVELRIVSDGIGCTKLPCKEL